MPQIRIIAAMAANRVIGRGEGLPWNIEQEYQHYLNLIKDQTVIMGRKSYNIFGDDLTSLRVIVVSTSIKSIPEVTVLPSLKRAIKYAGQFEETIYLAGGQRIYQEGLLLADSLYISHIHQSYEGDTYFPTISTMDWQVSKRKLYDQFTFKIYNRL